MLAVSASDVIEKNALLTRGHCRELTPALVIIEEILGRPYKYACRSSEFLHYGIEKKEHIMWLIMKEVSAGCSWMQTIYTAFVLAFAQLLSRKAANLSNVSKILS